MASFSLEGILRKAVLMVLLVVASSSATALTPSQVFEKVKDSVVVVKTFDANGKAIGQGSGVLLPSGKIGTNCHVVKNAASYQVGGGKRFVPATIWGGDEDKDICLLETSMTLTTKPVQLGQAGRLKVGEPVYAVGAPQGLELSFTDGIVSQLRGDPPPYIQTTAAISPGSSGGGLFNADGQLVGLTTLYIQGGQSLNFAMPVEWVAGIAAGLVAPPEGSPPRTSAFKSALDETKWLTAMSRRLDSRISDPQSRIAFLKSVHYEASRAGLDPQLVLAMIEVLSNFEKYRVAKLGPLGYMQVHPRWVKAIGKVGDDLFDMRKNVRYGCTILRHYLDLEHGDLYRALNRYHNQHLSNPVDEKVLDDPIFPREVEGKWKKKWRYDGPLA